MSQEKDRPDDAKNGAENGAGAQGGDAGAPLSADAPLELNPEMKAGAAAATGAAQAEQTAQDEAGSEAEPSTGSTQLVPIIGAYGGTAIARRDEGPGSAAFAAEQLLPVLKGAAAGAPVKLQTISDMRLTLRATASIWARPEIVAERKTGCAPVGPVEETAEFAAAALAPLAEAELARGRGLSALRERLTDDPWTALKGLQGDDSGPLLAETRSVISRCTDCAGAGGFACVDCAGVGRRVCTSCTGSGQVDEGCPSCRRAAGGADQGKIALDPKRALTFLMDQISSGGSAGEAAERAGAGNKDNEAARRDCPECKGSGVRRADCAQCAGAGERRCQSCSGTGRVVCSPCAGTGFLTDIYSGRARYERSVHLTLSTGVAGMEPPAEAAAAVRRAWDALIESRAFRPRLVGFQSSGFAAQAVFEADMPLSRLRAVIGARSPRVSIDFWAAGEPAMLLDPPKALDTLHRKAVDRARLATREGRQQVASALSDLACGRAALRAAARRDRELPHGAFGPLASDGENARLLELARASHNSVGWREERAVWTGAAVLAAPAGWLAAQGLSEPAGMAVAPIAAAFSPETYASPEASPWWDAFGAVWALFVASAPFLILCLLAGSVAAWAYQRATRRTLGFARTHGAGRLFFGRTPLFSIVAAAALYLAALTIAAPEAPPVPTTPKRGAVQAAAVAEQPGAGRGGQQRGSSIAASAFGGGDELNAFARITPVKGEWRSNGPQSAVLSSDGKAVLGARCLNGGAVFRLALTGKSPWSEDDGPSLEWRTDRAALKVRRLDLSEDGSGAVAPEWTASYGAIRALRRDRNLSVDWTSGEKRGRHSFRLQGSSRALDSVLRSCQ